MKHSSTLILRSTVAFVGLVVLAICVLALPQAIHAELDGDFDYGPILLGLYVPAIPFFIALHQSWRLLNVIDKNKAFSGLSVKALKNIKLCAFVISGLFAAGMPYIFYVADKDDAPGVAAIGCIIIGASFVIAAFAGVLQKLLQNALDIKAENDLTV